MATLDAGLSVVNSALVRLGAQPIGSFADLSGPAVAAASIYPQVSSMLIADHFWSFALRDSSLVMLYQFQQQANSAYNTPVPAQTVPPRNYSYSNVYQLPADCLRVVGLRTFLPFELSGDQLITDDDFATLVYVANIAPTAWPPWFTELVILRLCAQMAIPVTDQTSRAQYYTAEAEKAWRRARAIDSQQATPIVYDLETIFLSPRTNPLSGS